MKKRLLFLGDSITDCDHLWDNDKQALGHGYVRMIADYLEVMGGEYEVINAGFNGFTSGDVLHYWQRNGKTLQPDVVTVLCGVNDIAEYFDMDYQGGMWNFSNNYTRLLDSIREDTGARLILMEPFVFTKPAYLIKWHKYVKDEIKFIQSLVPVYDAAYIPLYDGLMKAIPVYGENALTSDGMHLTQQGNELLAALWTQSLVTVTDGVCDLKLGCPK